MISSNSPELQMLANLIPEQRYRAVLLFGAPGSGKGTQGQVLARIPGLYHRSSGDVFRNIDFNSELGQMFYEYSRRGELVPDETTVKMFIEVLQAHTVLNQYKPQSDLLILDGIPRTAKQAEIMRDYLDVLKVIHLTCENEEIMFERIRKRALKQNRHDDADDKVIRRRWEVYEGETMPVLEKYPENIIADIDSTGSPAQVLHDILEALIPIQNAIYLGN